MNVYVGLYAALSGDAGYSVPIIATIRGIVAAWITGTNAASAEVVVIRSNACCGRHAAVRVRAAIGVVNGAALPALAG
jgi:hypothetical protein